MHENWFDLNCLTNSLRLQVFLNGRKSTLNFAEKINAYLVSVLWVDSCLKNQRRGDEDLYPASRNDVASPTAINRNKLNRLKSMQPKSFEEEMKKSGSMFLSSSLISFKICDCVILRCVSFNTLIGSISSSYVIVFRSQCDKVSSL